jgi:hypothetical protein
MGFFPAEQIGFVMLTNIEPSYGSLFNISVQCSLLSRLFGLNTELPALLATVPAAVAQQNEELADQTRPVDPAAVAPYLGLYADGFRVRLHPPDELRLEHDIRSFRLLTLASGGYVVADGPAMVQGKSVTFASAADGSRMLKIDGFEPAAWLTGG